MNVGTCKGCGWERGIDRAGYCEACAVALAFMLDAFYMGADGCAVCGARYHYSCEACEGNGGA